MNKKSEVKQKTFKAKAKVSKCRHFSLIPYESTAAKVTYGMGQPYDNMDSVISMSHKLIVTKYLCTICKKIITTKDILEGKI